MMRNKVNYIVGGALAFVFSIVAATGVLRLSGWPHRALWLPAHLVTALDHWTERIHIIAGLLLLVLVIYHLYRNWGFIMAVTEEIKREREEALSGGEDLEEEESSSGGGDSVDDAPIDVIDEDDDEDEEEEQSSEALDDDEDDDDEERK